MIRATLFFALLFGMIIIVVGCDETHDETVHFCLGAADEQEGLVTVTVGITEYGLMYELGVVLVDYWSTKISTTKPSKAQIAVNDFLIKRGYTPRVKGLTSRYRELIDIGEGIDPLPLLEKIESIEGVDGAAQNWLVSTSESMEVHMPTYEPEEEVVPLHKKGLIEIGRTEDGDLYKLGRAIVEYDEAVLRRRTLVTAPVPAVYDFFINKGYTPRLVIGNSRSAVIEIGECIDIAPMLDELKSIPGVADAELDIVFPLHTIRPWLES